MKAYQSKRPHPNQKLLAWRSQYLQSLQYISPRSTQGAVPSGFEHGNSKTGVSGTAFSSIFIWNLPSIVTCPAATVWCRKNCYNADPRSDKFPVDSWAENWWWTLSGIEVLSQVFVRQINQAVKPCAVRIHSSGDFYATDYITFWGSFIIAHPNVTFWAYTRSWAISHLRPLLEHLHSIANLQLFASWDSSMPPPPMSWRKSLVFESEKSVRKHLSKFPMDLVCPEQIGLIESCASCGLCMHRTNSNVLFLLH